ncbi:hypothetical protein BGZ76_009534 [Entomortierella beljakovae]|nr:hypothetical protein BGZ76_009534 [Entomortierella beljakovae]
MAERSAMATYRPDSGNEGKAYMLDQPFTESQTVLMDPDQMLYETHLVQHLSQVEQHHQDIQNDGLEETPSSPRVMMTTTTTTTTTTTVSSPRQSTRASITSSPTTIAPSTTEGNEEDDSTTLSSEPQVIRAPSPTHTLIGSRTLSILRHGLFRNNRNSISGSTVNSRNSVASNQGRLSPEISIYVPPSSYQPSSRDSSHYNGESSRPHSSLTTRSNSADSTSNNVTVDIVSNNDDSSNTEASSIMPRSLSRLRSYGPPPYIPSAEDEAPSLPPSYNTVTTASLATTASV